MYLKVFYNEYLCVIFKNYILSETVFLMVAITISPILHSPHMMYFTPPSLRGGVYVSSS